MCVPGVIGSMTGSNPVGQGSSPWGRALKIDGERELDILCKGMGASGEQLMLNLIEELNKLAPQ